MAIRFVGIAALDQGADHRNHFRDVFCRPWLDVRRQHTESRHVVVVCLDEPGRDGVDRLAGLYGRGIDLVIDVGDVAGEGQFVAAAQQARQQVEHYGRARVADVRVVVHGGSAQVHRDLAGTKRRERNLFAPQGVVQM